MRKWGKLLTLWFLMGGTYYLIEIVYRLATGGGWPHWSMWIVGGLCGVAVGAINQVPRFYSMKVWKQALIGTVITLAVELAAGCVLNLWLRLEIWDYSGLPLNFMGQICLPFALIWFVIMPFAIWREDRWRLGFGWDGKAYTLVSIYLDFVFGR
jgi:hypothetical protein